MSVCHRPLLETLLHNGLETSNQRAFNPKIFKYTFLEPTCKIAKEGLGKKNFVNFETAGSS